MKGPGFILGVFGGLAGLVIWLGLSYFAGETVGWLGWSIGALVGTGCLIGTKKQGSVGMGVGAAVVALIITLLGRLVDSGMHLTEVMGEHTPQMVDERALTALELDTYERWRAQGMDLRTGPGQKNTMMPKEVSDSVKGSWSRLSEARKDQVRERTLESLSEITLKERAALAFAVQIPSLSINDFVWLGLGLPTAFWLARMRGADRVTTPVDLINERERGMYTALRFAPSTGETQAPSVDDPSARKAA